MVFLKKILAWPPDTAQLLLLMIFFRNKNHINCQLVPMNGRVPMILKQPWFPPFAL